jgi:hypothetical protein
MKQKLYYTDFIFVSYSWVTLLRYQKLDFTASNCGMIDELEVIWKEAAVSSK